MLVLTFWSLAKYKYKNSCPRGPWKLQIWLNLPCSHVSLLLVHFAWSLTKCGEYFFKEKWSIWYSTKTPYTFCREDFKKGIHVILRELYVMQIKYFIWRPPEKVSIYSLYVRMCTIYDGYMWRSPRNKVLMTAT